jgi:type VI secretion system secreted protein VgrG
MGASTEYTQANRPIRVETALGPDVLLLTGFSSVEGVSQPYSVDLDLMSLQSDVDPEAFLRKPVLISIEQGEDDPRYIHGIASRLAQLGTRDDLAFYRARIVPWLWFLGLSRESRIYQNMTVPAILEQIFKDHGYTDYDLRLTGNYEERIYCVQYRETHLDFVSRLMEDEGIYYYFEHSEDKHVLVLADDNNSLSEASPGADTLEFVSDEEHGDNVVMQLERVHSVHPGKVTLWDYDYLQPNVKLNATFGEKDEEVYDFPGNFTDPNAGLVRAGTLWEVETGEEAVVRGTSNAPGLTPGYNFTLKHHYRRDANVKYFLTEVRHSAHMGGYRGWGDGAALDYRVEFFAIPNDTPYMPPRRTPRPVMWSSQTALVVGPKGEEVHVDKYGRIKVQFYWDREGKRDENSSCWVRVATPWGGKGWGSVSIPRMGNEVVVAFEEGDPDRPLVIGSVYNADQMPPFTLPGAGIQMGMKSRSSPGGGGMNEITMTDTKGKEMLNIHAQYDMVTTVEHDMTDTVKSGNRAITIAAGTHTESIKKDTSITVTDGNYALTIAKGTATVKVEKKVTETFNDAQETTVKGNITITSSTGKIDIEAANEIKLHTGDSTITLSKSGEISIKGKKISIVGDDEIKASAKKVGVSGGDEAKFGVDNQQVTCDKQKVNLSGAAINSSAVGMHEITGAVVKIN